MVHGPEHQEAPNDAENEVQGKFRWIVALVLSGGQYNRPNNEIVPGKNEHTHQKAEI